MASDGKEPNVELYKNFLGTTFLD